MSRIVVLNAGGQYCHLIARRIREFGIHAVVADIATHPHELREASGIVISGGPASVNEEDSPSVHPGIYRLGIPILGICYGHQLMAKDLGGLVARGYGKEYGHSQLTVAPGSALFEGLEAERSPVWMSHGDTVLGLPPGFEVIGRTDDCKIAAMENRARLFFGLQFHPEVAHTAHGGRILENFVVKICGCGRDWNPRSQLDQLLEQIRTAAIGRNVFFLISGGVDSTVAFYLCYQALGPKRVRGLYVDTGFMRRGDTDSIRTLFSSIEPETIHIADRSADFFDALRSVVQPEEKRSVIGNLFLRVQQEEFRKLQLGDADWLLGQGTIYPDTIESGGTRHSAKIKTHHNRVPQIQALIEQGKIIEPLTEFYKDEVRALGEQLGLPGHITRRHPFPGPGLAVRCLCSERDVPTFPASRDYGVPPDLSAQIIPLKTVGVQGDERSYANIMAIDRTDDFQLLSGISRSVTNRHRDINRVVFLAYARQEHSLSKSRIHRAFLTRERIELLREADAVVTDVLRRDGWYDHVWQFPVGLLPVSSSEGGETVVLRPVHSRDGMTADFVRLPEATIRNIVDGLKRIERIEMVFYDVTNKPPATIEFE
jgi:GMP synthase (glutamine-hydrolysing)